MLSYAIAITQNKQAFHAQVPDLPSLNIVGDSIIDTIAKARATINEHLQTLTDPPPTPQNLQTHLSNPQFVGSTWAIINVDVQFFSQLSMGVSVNLPRTLIQKIRQNLSTDQNTPNQADIERFIIEALEQKLNG